MPNSYAEEFQQELTTNNNLLVRFLTIPQDPGSSENTDLKIEFINPQTLEVQEHVDYSITIEKSIKTVFETSLTHTSLGIATIPVTFDEDGTYDVIVEVYGILFAPIPKDTAIFSLDVGQVLSGHEIVPPKHTSIPDWVKQNAGWWSDGLISDEEFAKGLEFLVENGVISV